MEEIETITATIAKIQTIAVQLSGVQGDSQQLDALLDEMQVLTNKTRNLIEDSASRLAKDIFRCEFKGRSEVKLSVFVDTLYPAAGSGCLRSSLRAGMQAGLLPGVKKDEHWYVTQATLTAWFRRRTTRKETRMTASIAA
ncbi:MAG: hypothetical protein FPO08_07355 [Geobacter sp.]|nr:MAG: hypothetical protein FPO08_07355 [Geobacter sp.]